MSIESFNIEVKSRNRFEFGKNWKNFLANLTEEKIQDAENSLKNMLGEENLEGKNFLDVGSGSGLFSLAARNLGAEVFSFDFDITSVNCTEELKKKFYLNDNNWKISHGSVLDSKFLAKLDKYDYVYSWGVLHHTGNMWKAFSNIIELVKFQGSLFISIYNHQEFASTYWTFVKKTYNRFKILRPVWFIIHFLYPALPSIIIKFLTNRKETRGMFWWTDLIDWLGGYPFETATPFQIFNFYKSRGFTLTQLKTVGGKLGCNEFVFRLTKKNNRNDI